MATTMLKKAQYLLGAGALALASFPAAAGVFISDVLTVYDANHNVFAQVWAPEPEDPTAVYFIDDLTLADPNQFNNFTALIEPDGTNNISDFFGVVTFDGVNFFLAFQSDGDPPGQLGQGPLPAPVINLDEVDNFPYPATMYLRSDLQAAGWTATFISGEIHVPEPGSLALLGLGTFALGAFRRTLRRT